MFYSLDSTATALTVWTAHWDTNAPALRMDRSPAQTVFTRWEPVLKFGWQWPVVYTTWDSFVLLIWHCLFTQDQEAQTNCNSCPAGYSCLDKTAAPVPCLAGSFSLNLEMICTVSIMKRVFLFCSPVSIWLKNFDTRLTAKNNSCLVCFKILMLFLCNWL